MKIAQIVVVKSLICFALLFCVGSAITADAQRLVPLNWSVNGGNVSLFWPVTTNDYWQLSYSTNAGADWANVATPPSIWGNNWLVTAVINPNIGSMYYRLESTGQPGLYSVNGFGYISFPVPQDSTNQFFNIFLVGINLVGDVLPSAANGTVVAEGDWESPTNKAIYEMTANGEAWIDPATGDPSTMHIYPNDEFWYYYPAGIPMTLTIYGNPAVWVYEPPTDQSSMFGSNVSFSIGVTATSPTYQWQFDGTNLADNANISGANASTLTVLNISPGNLGNYAVIVNSAYGSVTSSIVTLSAIAPPLPSQPPVYISGTNLIWNFTNGVAGTQFFVRANTNLSSSLSNWTFIQTNTFDSTGAFQVVLPIESNEPSRFYRLSW